ncbi:hypothetical protein PG995_004507 [Apiospora arundinis]
MGSPTAATRPSAAPTATPRSPRVAARAQRDPQPMQPVRAALGQDTPRLGWRAPRQQQPDELTERRDVVEVRNEHAEELGHGTAGGPSEPYQQTLSSEYRRIIAVHHERASEY